MFVVLIPRTGKPPNPAVIRMSHTAANAQERAARLLDVIFGSIVCPSCFKLNLAERLSPFYGAAGGVSWPGVTSAH